MIRVTVDLLDPRGIGGQGTKEAVAMALERFGPVRVVRVQDSEERPVQRRGDGCGGRVDLRQIGI